MSSIDPIQTALSRLGANAQTPAAKEKASPQSAAPLEVGTPLQFIPGIGPQRVELFHKLGVRRAIDLLFLFPRSYQDIAPFQSITELEPGIRASVVGQIVDMDQRVSFEGRSSVGVLLAVDGGGYVRCVWYNQPFRRQQFLMGMRVIATGIAKSTGISFEMRHPETTILAADQPLPEAKPIPVYPLTEGLQQRHVASAVAAVLEHLTDAIDEALPESIRKSANLPVDFVASETLGGPEAKSFPPLLGIAPALRSIHQPKTVEEANEARHRFIFQELFVYQLALAMRRHRLQHDKPAPKIAATPMIHARILKRFGFELTRDQLQAIEDVRTDMAQDVPMNRLIQGDVGSGKTVIAQYAMLNAVASKQQAALMAPTELLARQHFTRLRQQLAGSQVMIELLVGSITQRERTELLQRIAIGTVDLVVGTQALLSEQVQFESLGLVVIDEQHKFGVQQRANLRESRMVPHYLVLSATPIPRTIAMTVFGDLDVSVLRDKPPGRATVHTYLGSTAQQAKWWEFVVKQIQSGRQAYVVTPRVESDAEAEIVGAEQVYQQLMTGPLAGLRIELLHGRMDGSEKQAKLDAFTSGKTQVLVATTVIEVGIDVPNATVMTILDADRMGLAQLHQLRGRISRGSFPGYVCVFAKPGVAPEENARLSVLASTDDGFRLAEQDLQMRGPGDLLGTKQIGLPPLRIADLVRDSEVLICARKIAQKIVEQDPNLDLAEHAKLKRQVTLKHGAVVSLGDVG
ncbi:MAG: ATP-dependent DNA helicase RecG [Planctomycetota bacterium]|nr:ATP-dependent DNA helicase RecG [Planctomycetota bacterium]